jgi:hypothetical protein
MKDEDELRPRRFLLCQRWLLILGAIIVVFGVALALLYSTPLFDIFRTQIDPAFWGVGELTGGTALFQQWIYGVLGATMAGWGVCIAFIAAVPFKRKEKWAWNCLATAVSLWFVVDTFLSGRFGVMFNVAFNVLIFLAALVPLAFSRKYFLQRTLCKDALKADENPPFPTAGFSSSESSNANQNGNRANP